MDLFWMLTGPVSAEDLLTVFGARPHGLRSVVALTGAEVQALTGGATAADGVYALLIELAYATHYRCTVVHGDNVPYVRTGVRHGDTQDGYAWADAPVLRREA